MENESTNNEFNDHNNNDHVNNYDKNSKNDMLYDITSLSSQIDKVKYKIDKNNPKMQIFLSQDDNMKLLFNSNLKSKPESSLINKNNDPLKFINIDSDVKVLLISILINILIKPERGTLNSRYCDQFPYDNNKPN